MPDAIKIQMVLDKVQIFLAKWLDCHLKGLYKVNFWQSAVLNALTPEQRINVEECIFKRDLGKILIEMGNWVFLPDVA